MSKIRKFILSNTSYIVWTLIISLGYAIFESFVDLALEKSSSGTSYYLKGFLVLIPLVIIGISIKKCKNLGYYLIIGLALLGVFYFLTKSVIFVSIIVIIWAMHLHSRIDETKSILAEAHASILFIFLLYFLISAYQTNVFMQKTVLYYLTISALFIIMRDGITRFDRYISIKDNNEYLPKQKILDTATSIFLVVVLLLAVFILPIITYRYDIITIDDIEVEYAEELYIYEEEIPDEEVQSENIFDLISQKESNLNLQWIWEILDKMLMVLCVVAVPIIIFTIIYKIAKGFSRVQFEKDDIVEDIKDDKDETKKVLSKFKINALLDFSEEMKVRRKYKKTLKRYSPKGWQTPFEMEEMAKINIPELHDMYEKVRYGKSE